MIMCVRKSYAIFTLCRENMAAIDIDNYRHLEKGNVLTAMKQQSHYKKKRRPLHEGYGNIE